MLGTLRGAYAALLVACAAIMACTTPAILAPATGPGTEYPCGVGGRACSDPDTAPTLCCDPGFVCCDGSQCPSGMCAYVGDAKRLPDAGAALVPQRRADP